MCIGVFLVHPPLASVLLFASVERCFVSRMQDFFKTFFCKTSHDNYYFDVMQTMASFEKNGFQPFFEFLNGMPPPPPGFDVIL